MTEISVRTLRFLLSLAETESPRTAWTVVEDEVGPELATLTATRLLVPGPNLEGVPAYPGDQELRQILDADRAAGTVTCFHPDSGLVTVPADHLRTWRLDCQRLAALISRQVGLPASSRPTGLVEGLLWRLGEPRLGGRKQPVLFARRLGHESSRQIIRAELDQHPGRPRSVLMTSASHVCSDLRLPAVSKIRPPEVLPQVQGFFG